MGRLYGVGFSVLLLAGHPVCDLGPFAPSSVPGGAVVRSWNEQTLTTLRIKSAVDAEAARALAMVNLAIYDAVNGIDSVHGRGGRAHALVPFTTAPANGDLTAAAASAAHAILSALYPDQVARFDAQLTVDLAGLNGVGRIDAGRSWGQSVAAQILAMRTNDGSSPAELPQAADPLPGQFRASWSNTQYRNLLPFGIASVEPYVGSLPPALTSAAYATAWLDVKTEGGSVPADAAKLATYLFWSMGGGTCQPPGAWIQIALAATVTSAPDVLQMARLFALLSMTMADTVAPTYATKFATHSWRPTTAIREADTDENPATTAEPTWVARGAVGGTPEHWSGHSTFSGAAAQALAGFFCNDAIAFSFTSDSVPAGPPRSYPGFSSAASEAGRSRIFGGLHFEFSNQAALQVGKRIANEVLATKLLKLSGPRHKGACPL